MLIHEEMRITEISEFTERCEFTKKSCKNILAHVKKIVKMKPTQTNVKIHTITRNFILQISNRFPKKKYLF